MSWMARRARGAFLLSVFAAVALGAVLLLPAKPAAPGPGETSAVAVSQSQPGLTPVQVPTPGGAGQPFAGVAAVGALFSVSDGKLGSHFCSAAVVHSAGGDLAVTAAHCVTGRTGPVAFVPGYDNGTEPYGSWLVTAVYTDPDWQSDQDPDDDVAFLRLARPDGAAVEDATGAEQFGAGAGPGQLVQVVAYPDDDGQPLLCASWAKGFSATQLEFDCDGYSDGSSGGPLLAGISAATGQGTIIGVIGGYQQGGDTPDVSYASAFGPELTALYASAQAAG